MLKIGLIVNPVAGIGGKVGLKGSDGEETQRRARCLGAQMECNHKAMIALEPLSRIKDAIEVYTYPAEMGGGAAQSCGMQTVILGKIKEGSTTQNDTVSAAREMLDAGVKLILFAGGDGTARDILDAVGTLVPVIGIPAGCKIHSAVYALNPRRAGELAVLFALGKIKECRDAEVMDIDEALFRQNRVQAKLYGYLRVPQACNLVQNMKSGRGQSEAAAVQGMAEAVIREMEEDTLYIIGPGSTTRAIMDSLGQNCTLLGVDLVRNRKTVANDVTEKEILSALEQYDKAKIIVTVIGGQGYVFGRGNQQISADVIRRVGRENIMIVASKGKMLSLLGQNLYVDTGDEAMNEMLCGYYKVVVGYEDNVMWKLTC